MRVAVDVTIPDRAITGVGVYARGLLAGLAARPLEVRRWQLPLDEPGRRRLRNGGRLLWWHQLGVPRRVRREGIAVYHSACAVGPIQDACPTILTVHDGILASAHASYGHLDRLYHRIFGVEAARRAAAVIVPSDHTRSDLARLYRIPRSRLHLVPHGISDQYRPRPACERDRVRARYGLRRPFLLCVGARTPRKNLPRTVEGFAHAITRRADAVTDLVLVGPGARSGGDIGATLSAAGLEGRVHPLGIVADDDMPALYGASAGLLYPSLYEGFGLPIVEAMACGVPVLTSAGGATEEVAGGAALLVDPTDVHAIADGIDLLLGDAALRADLVRRGRARSREFSWRRTAALTERLYRALAG
jgi:glycosyltransferase involved in cell wall biosynthesis